MLQAGLLELGGRVKAHAGQASKTEVLSVPLKILYSVLLPNLQVSENAGIAILVLTPSRPAILAAVQAGGFFLPYCLYQS